MVSGFDHIDVVVKDIHQATRDYERILGIKPTEVAVEQEGQGFMQSEFQLGDSGSYIYIVQPTSDKYQAGAAMKKTLERSGEGIHVIALTVDVGNLMEHVKKSGEDVITSKHSHSFFVHPKKLNRVLYQLMAPRLSNGTIKAPDFT